MNRSLFLVSTNGTKMHFFHWSKSTKGKNYCSGLLVGVLGSSVVRKFETTPFSSKNHISSKLCLLQSFLYALMYFFAGYLTRRCDPTKENLMSMVIGRGVNFFRGQGGMKARIDRHSQTFFLA